MIKLAKQSFGRCLNHGDLIGRFYEILLQADPMIPRKFINTDMEKQKKLLVHSINLALMFAENDPVGKNGLLRLRESHNKKHLDIKPDLYPLWIDSFLQAVSEIDPEYNDEIKFSWYTALKKTTDYLAEGYQD